ncbi:MAG: DNA polymerase III subunit epsilon, partial [Pseudomonadales bacterium]|nr:DNA polymerase III subunit epsilon [Pseudomonadales bacterium]
GFDVAFLNQEMKLLGRDVGVITDHCRIVDSLEIARNKHPGQKNNLDALCKRYNVDNSQRDLHGALLDAEILADVYLLMTGGQVTLSLGDDQSEAGSSGGAIRRLPASRPRLKVIRATEEEVAAHRARLDALDVAAENGCVWKQLEIGL